MIFESGVHLDFGQIRAVGPEACIVAVVGTLLPLVCGAALVAYGFGFDLFPDGIAAGVSPPPTSAGIALRLLHEARALDKPFGQAIITAAFVDDILSLVLFNVLFSMGGGSFSFAKTLLPPLLGVAFMLVAAAMAMYVWPPFTEWMLSKIPEGFRRA
uniref:Cation/H+ exchanger transmembrane domain-containing protein n=1 Tax=Alexandrium monilatum TaxID=311494 RepID=A0A6T1M2D1_9DINO